MQLSVKARLILAFVLVNTALLGTAAIVLYKRPPTPPQIQGVFLPEARELPEFQVVDQNSEPFTNADLKGSWHLVSYGFTSCPDFCPTTLSELTAVARELPPAYDDLRFVFYSVDHERDTPSQLASYLSYFNPEFIGLTHRDGDRHLPFEQGLGMASELIPEEGDGEDGGGAYRVNHGVTLYLLNPAGKLQAIFRPDNMRSGQPGFNPDKLLRDYLAVREYLG